MTIYTRPACPTCGRPLQLFDQHLYCEVCDEPDRDDFDDEDTDEHCEYCGGTGSLYMDDVHDCPVCGGTGG